MTQDKAAWRRAIRQRRRARPASEQACDSQALARQALAHPQIRDARSVAAYLALPGEPDLGILIEELRAGNTRVLLPVVHQAGLTFAEYDGTTRPGGATPNGLRIPEPTGPVVPVSQAEVVLLPALAVDRRGVRLGQGGGYYDRTDLRGPRLVGVVHDDEFVTETLPAQPYDTVVHGVLTPRGLTWLSPLSPAVQG